jgi:tetratricopeptide (TPR) repeat protein
MYDAFISYSHANDKPIAAALQSAIQTLGKPWWKVRVAHVFRDDTSLTATPALWAKIQEALVGSQNLIFLACPQSAQSKWCNREVAFWIETKGPGSVLIGLTEGELVWDEKDKDFVWTADPPLPEALQKCFAAEPLWIDLRPFRNVRPSRRDQNFLSVSASLAAAVRGVPRENLLSEELVQQRRNLLLARGAAVSLSLLAAAAVWQAVEATRARNVAQDQRDRAQRVLNQVMATSNNRVLALAERMQGGAAYQSKIVEISNPSRKPSLSGPERASSLIDLAKSYLDNEEGGAALDAAQASLAILSSGPTQNPPPESILISTAKAHQLLADTNLRLGKNEKAAIEAAQSLSITEDLVAAHPDEANLRMLLAASYQGTGDVARQGKDWEKALNAYRRAFELASQSGGKDSDQSQFAADINLRMALVLTQQSKFDEALALCNGAVSSLESLGQASPEDKALRRPISVAYSVTASTLVAAGKPAEALGWLEKDIAIAEQLANSNQSNPVYLHDVSVSYDQLGKLCSDLHKTEAAIEAVKKGISYANTLGVNGFKRLQWQRDTAVMYENLGLYLAAKDKLQNAIDEFRQSLQIRERLAAVSFDPSWQRELENVYRRTRTLLLKENRPKEALETAEQELFETSFSPENDTGKQDHLARVLGGLSWTALFARDFPRAKSAAAQAMALAGQEPSILLNYAHALLFTNDVVGAQKIYLEGLATGGDAGSKWRAMLIADFKDLSAANLHHEVMDIVLRQSGS